jgi:GAF domain-containing protein
MPEPISQDKGDSLAWPFGGGEVGALVRAHDWASTPLGPIESWPPALRTAVDLTLASPAAAIVLWGPRYIQIYNDLWATLHRSKHPSALGQPTHECFAELLDALDPVYDRVWRGEGVLLEDSLLPVLRHGKTEDAWWNVVYTPVRGESGAVEGIFCTLSETTAKVCAERAHASADAALRESEARQGFLLKLADVLRTLADPLEVQFEASRVLGEHLGADRTGYAECEDGIKTVIIGRHYTNGVPGVEGRHSLDTYGATLASDLLHSRAVVRHDIANDPELTEAEKAAFARLPVGAMADVPLVKAGRLVAIIFVHYRQAHEFTSLELSLMEAVAERTWAAVERARAEAALRESQDRQAFLLKLSDALRTSDDPLVIQSEACRLLGERLGVDRAYYVNVDEAAGSALVECDWVREGVTSLAGEHRVSDFAWSLAILRRGECHVIPDTQTSPLVPPDDRAASATLQIIACMGAPLIKANRLVPKAQLATTHQ